MTTPIPSVQLLPASEDNIAIAANILRSGGLVAFPTETLYGLGADARIDAAVQKVFAAKARPPEKPLIVLVQDLREAIRYGLFDQDARRLAEAFWPGALTLIVNRREPCPLSAEINPGGATVALRAPGSDIAMRLLDAFSGPLTAPSANRSGAAPPIAAEQVMHGLGATIDAVLDGGSCPGGESSIVELT
ncbi:MAG: L-threonylcarbamoyladenylate synthase, partial [Alphaproteobacteria bacterium]